MSHCSQLKELGLRRNKIKDVDWRSLPPTLTKLHLSSNELLTVGDCNHCAELSEIDLSGNPELHSIHALPDTEISLFIDSLSVTVLGRKCFHENTYNKLKTLCQALKWRLEQPPVEVMLQGLEAVLEYYTENSVRTTQTR